MRLAPIPSMWLRRPTPQHCLLHAKVPRCLNSLLAPPFFPHRFERIEVTREEALAMFQENKFKVRVEGGDKGGGRRRPWPCSRRASSRWGGGGEGGRAGRRRDIGERVTASQQAGEGLWGMRAARQGQELLGCRRLTTH